MRRGRGAAGSAAVGDDGPLSTSVRALVVADAGDREHRGPALVGEAVAALEAQTRAPDGFAVAGGAEVAVAVRAALAAGAEWLWLLDGSAIPEPDALEALLTASVALEPVGPDLGVAPVLLASRVVTAEGTLDPGSLPVPSVVRADLIVAAYDRRLVTLRLARRGSLLVHRRAFGDRSAQPASPLDDDLAWTARLLRHELGLLVPASVVVRVESATPARGAGARVRLLTGDALHPRERPWFAFRLAEECVAAGRARLARVEVPGWGAGRRGGRE